MLKGVSHRAILNKQKDSTPVINKGVAKKPCKKHNVIDCKICKK